MRITKFLDDDESVIRIVYSESSFEIGSIVCETRLSSNLFDKNDSLVAPEGLI